MAAPTQSKSTVQRLWRLLAPERSALWVAVVYAIAVGVLSLAIPIGVQSFVNTVGFGQLMQPVVVLALLVFAGISFAGVMRVLHTIVVEIIQQRVFARVALDLSARLPRVRTEELDGTHGPELVNRFFDVLTVQKGAAVLLIDGISVVLATMIGLIVLAVYHPLLLLFGIVLAVAIGAIVFGLGRPATGTAIAESIAKYDVAAWLEELARHPATFRSPAGIAHSIGRTEALTRSYLDARRRHFRTVLRQIIAAIGLQVVASSALLGVGGVLVLERQLTIGQLVAAELILTSVLTAVASFGKYLETWYSLGAAVDKLASVLELTVEDTAPIREDALVLAARAGGMNVRAVGVGYGYAERATLEEVSFEVRGGELLTIVAPNGGGKSTLADLLYGSRRPDDGYIELDGLDVRDWSLDLLREQVALVRAGEVFAGTVDDNVRLGRDELGAGDVRSALEVVGLYDEIAELRDGMRTPLATGGAPLGAGHAERLVLARALAGRPRLLLIDGLDATEPTIRRRILRTIRDAYPRTTVIYFTRDVEGVHGHTLRLDEPPGRELPMREAN